MNRVDAAALNVCSSPSPLPASGHRDMLGRENEVAQVRRRHRCIGSCRSARPRAVIEHSAHDEAGYGYPGAGQTAVNVTNVSAGTQAIVAVELGHLEPARASFAEAALIDLDDLEHNTRDGLPLASPAGAWMVVIAGFGGIRDHDGILSFRPRVPVRLTGLAFGMCFRSRRLYVEISHDWARYSLRLRHGQTADVTADEPVSRPIPDGCARERRVQPAGGSPVHMAAADAPA
jgi:hypothetical protein